jgi:hypothetical protein
VVLMLGVLAVAGLRSLATPLKTGRLRDLLDWWRHSRLGRGALALCCGFAAGTFTWWTYAALVDARTFIDDHLRMHIAHRILLNDVRLAVDPRRYAPSIPEVWLEFAAHTGYLLLPVGLLGFAVWMFHRRRDDGGAVLLAWFLTGAVLYSLTDWRQTKHLMNQLAPLVAAALVVAWPVGGLLAQRGKRKIFSWVATAALMAALLINIAADVRLVADFSSLRISGASDVDGW